VGAALIGRTTVAAAQGSLRAGIWAPESSGPLPGLVLVGGAGDGTFDDWGGWPERIADCGVVVLTYDKPGCGGSPGNWTRQTLVDRAHESLAALAVLRDHPSVHGQPVGMFGVSQGGWVVLLASTVGQPRVDYLVTLSGPGVSPAVQERARIERELRANGMSPNDVAEALVWLDERTERLVAGELARIVLEDQVRLSDRPWYAITTQYFDNEEMLAFLAGLLDFEPADVLPRVSCPVLALFGAADDLVPVPQSVAAYAQHLPQLAGDPHGIAVFPGADHGLFTASPDPAVPRTSQLAAGFLPMLTGYLDSRQRDGRPPDHPSART
jgi:pimeloyl-ACP methyl ester carboxylesterase